jgi:transcription elongation factor GreA
VKRQEVAQRLHEAMEGGELIEGAEYEAAKNEQAFVEGASRSWKCCWRMRDRRNRQRDIVQVAAKVTIQEDENEPELYTIVGPAEANPREGASRTSRRLGGR